MKAVCPPPLNTASPPTACEPPELGLPRNHDAIAVARCTPTTQAMAKAIPMGACTGAGVSVEFAVGERVKYWSSTHQKWIDAFVQCVHRGEAGQITSYDLTAKAQAKRARVSHASTDPDASPPPIADYFPGEASPPLSTASPPAADAQAATLRPALAEGPHAAGLASPVSMLGPPPDGLPHLPQGSPVQYWSGTKCRWLDSKVEATHVKDGIITYDLGCKKGVCAQKVRLSESFFSVGEDVEFWSVSASRWILAKVLKIVDSSTCDLDVKPNAMTSRIRKATGLIPRVACNVGPDAEAKADPSQSSILGQQHKSAPAPPLSCVFEVGDKVQYWSNRNSRWMESTVKARLEKDGLVTYDLHCKVGALAEFVRPSPGGSSNEQYEVGEMVEYWSNSSGRWVSAKVTRTFPANVSSCDLDIKSGASFGRMRKTQLPLGKVGSSIKGSSPGSGSDGSDPSNGNESGVDGAQASCQVDSCSQEEDSSQSEQIAADESETADQPESNSSNVCAKPVQESTVDMDWLMSLPPLPPMPQLAEFKGPAGMTLPSLAETKGLHPLPPLRVSGLIPNLQDHAFPPLPPLSAASPNLLGMFPEQLTRHENLKVQAKLSTKSPDDTRCVDSAEASTTSRSPRLTPGSAVSRVRSERDHRLGSRSRSREDRRSSSSKSLSSEASSSQRSGGGSSRGSTAIPGKKRH